MVTRSMNFGKLSNLVPVALCLFCRPCQAAYDFGDVAQQMKVFANTDPLAPSSAVEPSSRLALMKRMPAQGRFFQFSIKPGGGGYPGASILFAKPVDFSHQDVLAVWFKTTAPLREFQVTINGSDGVMVDHFFAVRAAAPGSFVPANTWTRAYVPFRSTDGWVRFGDKMDFGSVKSLTFYTFDSSLSKKEKLYTISLGGMQLLSLTEARGQLSHTMIRPQIHSAALLERSKEAVIWTADPGEKILRDTPLPLKAPFAKAAAAAVAGNEFASLTWVVTPTRNLSRVTGQVSDLHSGDKRISAECVTLRYVDYVPGLLIDSPDPLPLLPSPKNEKPLNARAGQNLQVWASISVPKNTSPGTYAGEIELVAEANGRPLRIKLPLTLRVRPFSLPSERHLKSLFDIHHLYNSPASWYPEHSADYWGQTIVPFSAEYKTIMDSVFRDFAHIRMTPELHLTWYEWPNLQERLALHQKDGFDPVFSIAYNYSGLYRGLKFGESEQRDKIRERIRSEVKSLAPVASLGLAAAKIGDEPTQDFMPCMVMAAEDVQSIAPWSRSFAALTTPTLPPELIGKLNTWCMQWDFDFTTQQVRERLKAGDKFWTYGAEYKLNYAYLPIDLRAPYWLYWKWNISGVHYSHHMHPAFLTYPNDTYPHSDGLQEIPSVRWEMIGHGAQDYEYLWMLDDLMRRAGRQGEKFRSLLSVPASLATDQTTYTNSPLALEHRRELIAQAIVSLQTALESKAGHSR